jgi:hypothetical protein
MCVQDTASLGVGNWLLKPVKIPELTSVDDLVLLLQSDDLQHSCDVWNGEMTRRNLRTVLGQVRLYKYTVYPGIFIDSSGRIE